MTWQLLSVLPVWLLSVIAAVTIGLVSPAEQRLTWIAIAAAGAIIVTFAIQLAIQRKDGFVLRAITAIGGAFVVLAIATGLFALLG